MARIKLKGILKQSFPLANVAIINTYYMIIAMKNSRKYFDKWDIIYEQKWNIAKHLHLENPDTSRKDILDIGAGPHIFAWIAVKLGHSVTTTELPIDNDAGIDPMNIRWFSDIKKAIGLTDKQIVTYEYTINKLTDTLPIKLQNNTWDIITLQRTNFDISWIDCDDYDNLISLLMSKLRPKGKIYFECPHENFQTLRTYLSNKMYKFEITTSEFNNQGKKQLGGFIISA